MIVKRVRYKEKWNKKYRYTFEITSYWLLGIIPLYLKEDIKEVYKRV